MIRAVSSALSLALTILVLKLFLPEVATGLIELITKVITIANLALDHATITVRLP